MPRVVTDEHKAAMKRGRQISAAVDAYLKAVDQPKRRGRPVSVEELRTRRAKADSELADADGLARLKLIQSIRDLDDRIAEATQSGRANIDVLEARFNEVAAEFAANQGIDYAAFRECGVPADTLKKAGIRRTRRASNPS